MPVFNEQFTLSNVTPKEVAGRHPMQREITMHNMTKSSNAFIHYGNEDMTLSNSPHIDPGETLTITLGPNDRLFAMSAPNGLNLGVLDVRKTT